MGASFTITQTPDARNLHLYPVDDTDIEFTPVGEANNYECVDESWGSPDISTYVYWTGIAIGSDIYHVENTSDLGTINYVAIHARAKSHTFNQSSSGTYDILLGLSTSGTTVKSSEATYGQDVLLLTGYKNFNCVWTSNPIDDRGWTWADINNLIIGVETSSPSIESAVNSTFRPNGDHQKDHLRKTGSDNYAMVDEEVKDDYGTYVYRMTGSPIYREDFYDYPNHNASDHTGTINSVTVFAWARNKGNPGYANYKIQARIKVGGTEYPGTNYNMYGNTGWVLISHTWTENPDTSSAWTWANIDDLLAGFRTQYVSDVQGRIRITQVYVVVNHEELNLNPEIRTTQVYARINYSGETIECFPLKPSNYSFGHRREVKKFNSWSGRRYVFDDRRASKTLRMTGVEYNRVDADGGATRNAIDTLDCVMGMKDNGNEITISGMDDQNINKVWVIRTFEYNQDERNPNLYHWELECERK